MRGLSGPVLLSGAVLVVAACTTSSTVMNATESTRNRVIVVNQDGTQVPKPEEGRNCETKTVNVRYDPVSGTFDIPRHTKVKRCDWVSFIISASPEADGRQGRIHHAAIFFISTDGDADAHPQPPKKIKHHCWPGTDIIVPTWLCSSSPCKMPVYLDMPDCNAYHYGVSAWYQPPGDANEYYHESDPDLEVSGGGPLDLCQRYGIGCH